MALSFRIIRDHGVGWGVRIDASRTAGLHSVAVARRLAKRAGASEGAAGKDAACLTGATAAKNG